MFWIKLKRILIASLIVCFAAWASIQVYAASKHRQVMAAWEKNFGPLNTIPTKYPPVEMNQCAIDLQSLSLNLGFSIWDRSDYQKDAAADLVAKEFDFIRNSLREYLKSQSCKATGDIEPVPADVATFIHAHRSRIEAVANLLLSSESPRWTFSLRPNVDRDAGIFKTLTSDEKSREGWIEPPGFRLLNYMALQDLLVAHALSMNFEGENAKAQEAFEASRRLDCAVSSRPIAKDLLLVNASWRQKVGLARVLPSDLINIELLSDSSNLREKSREALVVYGWIFNEFYIQIIKEANSSFAEKVNYWIGGFAISLMHGNYMDRLHHFASGAATKDSCSFKKPEMDVEWHENKSPFMYPALLWTPAWSTLVERVFETELAIEFTKLIQRYKAMPEWPTAPMEEPVHACASAKWLITLKPDGSLLLAIDREPPWYPVKEGLQSRLPLHFTLGPRNK